MQRFPLRSILSTNGVIRRAYHPSNSQAGVSLFRIGSF